MFAMRFRRQPRAPRVVIARFGASALCALGLAATACGGAPGVEALRAGDVTGAAAEVAIASREEALTDEQLVALARAVVVAALDSAKDAGGAEAVSELGPCATALADELAQRAEPMDAPGIAAAMLLLDRGLVDAEDYAGLAAAEESDPGLRALGARALVSTDDGDRRRAFVLDLDEGVRAAALRATFDAPGLDDREALVDALRRDPSPVARALAARALGRIGGARVVQAIGDAWVSADAGLRQALLDAIASPASFRAGGREVALRWTEGGGVGSVSAAALLSRLRGEAPGDEEARARAEATLRGAILRGAANDRVEAMVASPIDPESIAALRIAREDPDRSVAIVAHARLATVGDPADRTAALDALLASARGAGVERWRALAALAALAEPRATSLFVELAKANEPESRARAARWLVQARAMREATPLLTDADAAVRRVAACAVLRLAR
jgi:hypothetical protein